MEEKLELIKDEMSEKIINVAEKIVTMSGTTVTVRKILKELGITNRVFYNRFHNIDEVLKIVYTNTIERVRQSLEKDYDGKSDFFEYITDVVVEILIASYDIKKKFNQYIFEADSMSQDNYSWYMNRIKLLFTEASKNGLIKDVDPEVMGYAIWCFCRGFNADAVNRMSKEDAIKNFRYSFGILLEGIKIKNC